MLHRKMSNYQNLSKYENFCGIISKEESDLMKRILRIGMDVHSTNYTLCAIEPRFDRDDTIYLMLR